LWWRVAAVVAQITVAQAVEQVDSAPAQVFL
jgi:hypothetical protein